MYHNGEWPASWDRDRLGRSLLPWGGRIVVVVKGGWDARDPKDTA